MDWALLAFAVVVAVEIAIRLPLLELWRELQCTVKSVSRVVASRKISDHWKEKVLLAYSRKLMVHSLRLLLFLLCILSPLLLALVVANAFGLQLAELMISTPGTLLTLILALVYVMVRKRFASQ